MFGLIGFHWVSCQKFDDNGRCFRKVLFSPSFFDVAIIWFVLYNTFNFIPCSSFCSTTKRTQTTWRIGEPLSSKQSQRFKGTMVALCNALLQCRCDQEALRSSAGLEPMAHCTMCTLSSTISLYLFWPRY